MSKKNVKKLKEIFTKNIRNQKDLNFTFSQLEKNEIAQKKLMDFINNFLIFG